jgi:putative spermidine/putrescine transport system ATP-binding protein
VTRTFLGAVTRLAVATDVGEVTVDAATRPGLPDVGEQTVVRLDTDRVRAAT